jgi:hypothetical protein
MLNARPLRIVCFAFVMLFYGCATRTPFLHEAGLTAETSATLVVYRPQTYFHALNPERPFLYIDDKEVGTLSIGGALQLNLKPGSYRLSMREPILFMPAYESRAVSLDVKAGEAYYVRYAREFGGVSVIQGSALIASSTGFDVVPAEIGMARK